MAMGIFQQLDWLTTKVKRLCCAIEQVLPIQTPSDAGKFLQASGTGTVSYQSIYASAVSAFPVYFTSQQIYGSSTSPLTGNVTASLIGPNLGVVQKIYHQSGVAPTFPAGWVQLGLTSYSTTSLNIIYAEWAGGTRVEYWITQ